jgi:hypothetical protein
MAANSAARVTSANTWGPVGLGRDVVLAAVAANTKGSKSADNASLTAMSEIGGESASDPSRR